MSLRSLAILALLLPAARVLAQTDALPDPVALLHEVEANEKNSEQLLRQYTFHSESVTEELDGHGAVKKTETEERDFSVEDGVPVSRLVRKNGRELTPGEKAKEDERIQKEIAHAKERKQKAAEKGKNVDDRGEEEISLARILELGRFQNERRGSWGGRSAIVLDYTGNPNAKTHSTFEKVFKDLAGTVYIDETTRGLVHFEARFPETFRLGAGLIASVSAGTHLAYTATRVNDEIWLPAEVMGQGNARFLLLVHFNGRWRVRFSGYRKFHGTGRILPGIRPAPPESGEPPAADAPDSTSPTPHPQQQ